MSNFTVKLPHEFEHAVHLTKDELEDHIRLMAALKMFELGKISAGKAAELAGLTKVDFIKACGRYEDSVYNYPDHEVKEEVTQDYKAIKRFTNK